MPPDMVSFKSSGYQVRPAALAFVVSGNEKLSDLTGRE
jgi:hypothetical protein